MTCQHLQKLQLTLMNIKKLHFAFALFVSLFLNTYAQESPSLSSQDKEFWLRPSPS